MVEHGITYLTTRGRNKFCLDHRKITESIIFQFTNWTQIVSNTYLWYFHFHHWFLLPILFLFHKNIPINYKFYLVFKVKDKSKDEYLHNGFQLVDASDVCSMKIWPSFATILPQHKWSEITENTNICLFFIEKKMNKQHNKGQVVSSTDTSIFPRIKKQAQQGKSEGFDSHLWIQTGFIIWKCSIQVKIIHFSAHVT